MTTPTESLPSPATSTVPGDQTGVAVVPTTPANPPPQNQGPVAAATLPITIDASPWANVEITPVAQTQSSEVRKGTTPLVLELPVGDYSVRLSNPQASRAVTERIKVAAGGKSTFQFTMPGLDPEKILGEILAK